MLFEDHGGKSVKVLPHHYPIDPPKPLPEQPPLVFSYCFSPFLKHLAYSHERPKLPAPRTPWTTWTKGPPGYTWSPRGPWGPR